MGFPCSWTSSCYVARIQKRVRIWHEYEHKDTVKLIKYKIRNTMCIYMLNLKLSINTLSTNTKINLIYLSNIQNVKNSDSIRFFLYFNRQNHVKNKKYIFQIRHNVSYKYCRVSVSDVSYTGHAIYETCRSIISCACIVFVDKKWVWWLPKSKPLLTMQLMIKSVWLRERVL